VVARSAVLTIFPMFNASSSDSLPIVSASVSASWLLIAVVVVLLSFSSSTQAGQYHDP
jgi:hypothetical protein